jgi:hypothetical protein
MECRGTVARKRVAAGSKSDREAVVLQTPKQDFILRIRGGNPFVDERLEALVGKRIKALGEISDRTFLMDDWSEE